MVSSITANVRLVPRYGARLLVPTGMLLGCAGMVYLTGLDAHSNYASQILPSLLMMGLGFGLIFAPSIQDATLGVKPSDSCVASAMVNVSQQVGGYRNRATLHDRRDRDRQFRRDPPRHLRSDSAGCGARLHHRLHMVGRDLRARRGDHGATAALTPQGADADRRADADGRACADGMSHRRARGAPRSAGGEQIRPAIAVEVRDPARLLERVLHGGRCDISLLGVDR
jgi:hypothetical protein